MRSLLFAMLCFSGCCVTHAQELDGACRVYTNEMQWSGVAIAHDQVLTVAHHGLGVGSEVNVELPVDRHSGDVRVSVRGKIKRLNIRADLCLVRITSKHAFKIRAYKLAGTSPFTKGSKVKIRGYIMGEAMVSDVPFESGEGSVSGIRVSSFRGQAVQGMSGAPVLRDDQVVGIQFGGNASSIDAVTVEQIQGFLNEGDAIGSAE
jgi:hypothetical protein